MTTSSDNNNDERIEKKVEEIESTIKDTERFVSVFLLTVLQSILNEQQRAKNLDKQAADYIYLAVKDQAIRQGWIE